MRLPISYSLRNLRERPLRSVMTATVIALVVVACSLLLGLISSVKRTLVTTGDPLNLVVMRKGAENDGASLVPREAYDALRYFDGIARDEGDRPLVSPELVVQPFFHTRDGRRENVLVRGVEPVALQVHPNVRLVAGRMLVPSAGEAVVGQGVADRYAGAELGDVLAFGRGRWKVVGIFTAGQSSFESEVWVDVRELANDAKRPEPYSGVRVRAASLASRDALQRRIDADPRYALAAHPEPDYYRQQTETANALYLIVVGIALLAGVGSGFGAANTMYAAVQARRVEIGTLRALGFSRRAILAAFEIEAVSLALAGFAAGAAASVALAWLLRVLMGGLAVGAPTFTTNVVTLRVGYGDLGGALVLALVIGALGGLAPAWRAAHLRPIEALRNA